MGILRKKVSQWEILNDGVDQIIITTTSAYHMPRNSKSFPYNNSILNITLWDTYYNFPHFIDKELESQVKPLAQSSTACDW